MKAFKIFIILILISANTLYAQNRGQQKSMLEGMVPPSGTCKPLSQEEIDEINNNIQQVLITAYQEKMEQFGINEEANVSPTSRHPSNNWKRKILTNDYRVSVMLEQKYNLYDDMRYNQNWKNSPYSSLSSEEISDYINSLLKKTHEEMRKSPFYQTNNIGQSCGEIGTWMMDFAAFLILEEIASAALPAATTVSEYSAISGFGWNFSTLFTSPALLQGTSNFIRVGSTVIGFGASISVLDEIHSFTKDIFGVPNKETTSLGAQKDLHTALKYKYDLNAQIQEINNDPDLSPRQKQKRIDTRYKEAIIKIYALEYVNTYLLYAEKPEKYLWAILDLTTLLQNRGTITFEGDYGRTIEIETTPRLLERTPQMQQSLEKIMNSIVNGFKIPAYGNFLKNRVEKRAQKNFEKADINLDLDF